MVDVKQCHWREWRRCVGKNDSRFDWIDDKYTGRRTPFKLMKKSRLLKSKWNFGYWVELQYEVSNFQTICKSTQNCVLFSSKLFLMSHAWITSEMQNCTANYQLYTWLCKRFSSDHISCCMKVYRCSVLQLSDITWNYQSWSICNLLWTEHVIKS